MSTETLEPTEATDNEDMPLMPEFEAEIAGDDRFKDLRKPDEGGPERGEDGRFKSANEAGRAGQDDAEAGAKDEEGSTTGQPAEAKAEQQQQPKAGGAKDDKSGAAAAEKQSAWAKDNERRNRSWESLNTEKAAFQREREQLDIERKQFEEQQRTNLAAQKDRHGFTAGQYQQRAQEWNAQAMEAEARGDVAEADRLGKLAQAATERAGQMTGQRVAAVWQALGADLPEAMQYGSEMNQAIRAALKGQPEMMGSPFGPYRAAVKVGRELLLKQGRELEAAKAASAKVPALEKQVAELSGELKALRARTSPGPGSAALSRGGGGEDGFESMSLEKQEAWIRRQLAAQER